MSIKIADFIKRYRTGEFRSKDVNTQINAGWFDWFCPDAELADRLDTLGKLLVDISDTDKFDVEECYVFFKNNCPAYGDLYDSISIMDGEHGDVIYWVTPASGHSGDNKGKAQVFSCNNDFKEPLVNGSLEDVIHFFHPKK